jgi:outer membrane protein
MIRDLQRGGAILVGFAIVAGACDCGFAETMESALVKAYQNNPQLNAQRASARATDEAVPQALSGYRPRVTVTGTLGEQYQDVTTKSKSRV